MPLCPQITNTPITVTQNYAITAVTFNGSTATYTATGNNFAAGNQVLIAGLVPVSFNGTFTISSVAGANFTVPNTQQFSITGVSFTPSTATYTASGHNYAVGQSVTVSGLAPAGYNGTFTITSIVAGSTFTVSNGTNATVTDQNGSVINAAVTDQNGTASTFTVTDVVPVVPATTIQLNGKNKTFYSTTAPTSGMVEGDLWIDTDDGNKLYRYTSGSWISVQDGSIATAQSTANTAKTTADNAAILAANASSAAATAQTTATGAQTTANGKNTVRYSTSTPSGGGTNGDIWFQFDGSNNIIGQWTYNGSSWVANQITSTVIANIDAGKITTGTLNASLVTVTTSPSATDRITFSGSNNSITFIAASAAKGHILPMVTTGSSYGVLMHYGASPQPNGSAYPQAYVGATAAVIAGSSTNSLGSDSSGNSAVGPFTALGELYAAGHGTTANAANGYVFTTGGRIARSTASSERYKENIVDLADVPELDPKKLLDLPVRAFTYKEGELPETDDRYKQLIPGFIAEEVDAIYPVAADYVDGPESWNDRMIVPALLSLVQDLYKRIEKLENTTNS